MAAFVRFPSTFWTTIARHPERARTRIFTHYRTPIFNYIRNHGLSEHDAEDLTQEVFIRVCREDFLKKLDQARGKFRTLLLAVTRHVILKQRERRGRRRAASIEQGGLDGGPLDIQDSPEPDTQFDELWMQNLLRLALQRLMEECDSAGPRYYDSLVMSRLQGLPYSAIAERLEVSVADVTNWIHQGKKKLKAYLKEAIQGYSSSESEYRDELALLAKGLR